MKELLLIIFFDTFPFLLFSQNNNNDGVNASGNKFVSTVNQKYEIKNTRFEQIGNQIFIYYDLITDVNQKFDIKIFYSKDKGATWSKSLEKIKGDVGQGIKPGINKSATWDVLKEESELVGNIMFKVEVSFQENKFSGKEGNFIDARDGQRYKWVRFGDQIWMKNNLNYKTPDGIYKLNDTSTFYTWEIALEVCPVGWHLPSDYEWKILEDNMKHLIPFASGKTVKQELDEVFIFPPYQGFYQNGKNNFVSVIAAFWTSTPDGSGAKSKFIGKNDFSTNEQNKTNGLSVRCITQE
jgi:uncharacterized protein (TIGR02145 family)